MEQKKLQLGVMKSKEIAEWFGISYNTYRCTKQNRLQELIIFCDYKEIYGGVEILTIYQEVYQKQKKKNDDEAYLKVVKEAPLNSISNIPLVVSDQEDYQTLCDSQIYRRMAQAGVRTFGITEEEGSEGTHGSRHYQWSIKTKSLEEPYRPLTEKERIIFNELTIRVFGTEEEKQAEVLQSLALLDKTFEETNMTKEQYLKHKDRINFSNSFSAVIDKFKQITGNQIVRATYHKLKEESAF